MADVKISALPAATTPLGGAELVPIVQGGVTTRVSVDNLTAGRTVAASTVNVDANTASAAVRITQTGAGNALVVEDSASPDASPFVVDANGRLVIGTTSALTETFIDGYLQLASTGGTNTTINQAVYSTGAATFAYHIFSRSNTATINGSGVASSGDGIGSLLWTASDGTNQIRAASIESYVDGAPGTNDMPGRLVFSTTADGASTPTERMRITNAGNVGIGTGATSPTARLNVVDSTSQDAVRITQTGAGNALVVEDSANPDATPFVIDAAGRTIVGHTSAITLAGATPALQEHSVAQTQAAIASWGTVSAQSPLLGFYRSASGTVGTQGAVSSGFDLGAVNFFGDDGAAFIPSAQILAEVDGVPGTNDMPGRLVFSTTPDGTSSPQERMRITNAGNVGVGLTPATRFEVGQDSGSRARFDVSSAAQVVMTSLNVAGSAFVTSFYNALDHRWQVSGSDALRIETSGSLAVGTASANAAAQLDVQSTTKGFLPPRMTTAQRDAIASPPDGLVLYNSTTNKLQVRAASAWVDLH